MLRCSLPLTLLAGVCACRQVAGGVRALESGLLPRRRAVLAAVPLVAGAPRALAIAAPQASAVTVAASAVPPSAAAEFWSGLLAGAVQKTVKELALHPLDTAKARLQAPVAAGWTGGGRRAVFRSLFRSPYDGLAPALISGAPAASAFFAVKDGAKRAVAGLQLGKAETTVLAVACANVAYWGIKNPSEVLKVRRQAGVASDTAGAAVEIWRAEGVAGFYSSAGPNYAYSTPVDVVKFLLYEQLKASLAARRGRSGLSPVEAAVGGAAAAATAQALATPLDVARVRIMTSDATGVAATLRRVAAEEGAGALWAGVAPKVARALASGAIQFSTYEATKDWAVGYLARTFPRL